MTKHDAAYDGELERPGLIWQRGEEGDVEFTVWPERPITIGRDPINTITIESPFVSKAHAIFQFANGQYVIEDLRSSNGTRVNGAPIETAVVEPGDVVEIGDQRFLFVDRSAQGEARSKGLSKNAKLALVGAATFVVMGGLMMLFIAGAKPSTSSSAAASSTPSSSSGAPAGSAAAGAQAAAPAASQAPAQMAGDSEQVREVVDRAARAGVNPVDALFDEAMLQYRGGRLRDTAQLLAAVLARDPKHLVAGQRLPEVRRELEQAIVDHSGQASRAFSQLRYDAAVNEWEQVLLLADAADPRYREAQGGIDRARQLGAR